MTRQALDLAPKRPQLIHSDALRQLFTFKKAVPYERG